MAKLDEREDEDLYDYQPPPGPSPREVRRRWAEEGDIQALLDLIRKTPWSMISVGEQLQNLAIACRVGAKADPEGFSREVFAEMVGLTSFVTLRLNLYVAARVVGRGPMPCTPALADLAPDVIERVLPRLMDAQRGMAEVLHAQAVTARMWTLARAKRAANGEGAGAGSSVPPHARTSNAPEAGGRRRHAPDGKAGGTTNGKVAVKTNGKVVGTTNGVSGGAGGRRRHG